MLSKIGLALYWLALFTATHIPPSEMVNVVEANDKVEHFSAYMLLAFGIALTWQLAAGILNSRHLWIVWIVAIVYGALDEITQIPVHRDCDFWDWTADACGAAAGAFLFVLLRRTVGNYVRYREKT
ncbi:MAG TPA: VanZ family protein [Lacipirellulaceae bacterium]|nr:VanZ family protein [Lacipirellulaceae bacterium]